MESFHRRRFVRNHDFLLSLATVLTLTATSALLPVSARAQITPPTPPVVTITPNESAAALAKVMGVNLETASQILALDADKDARTPTQQKICSDFIYLARMAAGQPAAPGVKTLAVFTPLNADGSVKAIIRLNPTGPALAVKITPGGGTPPIATATGGAVATGPGATPTITSMSVRQAIVAVGGQILNDTGTSLVVRIPISQVETLAALPAIGMIDRFVPGHVIGRSAAAAIKALNQRSLVPYVYKKKTVAERRKSIASSLAGTTGSGAFSLYHLLLNSTDYNGENTGTISEGVTTHALSTMYGLFPVSGINAALGRPIRIGVLSDSDTYLSVSQANFDTPPTDASTYGTGPTSSVTIAVDDTVSPAVSQDGTGAGEGTAMMEIVHDMAPDAKIFFATASASEAQFAKNILLLRFKYNCDIICDDYGYFDEAVFSDGDVAEAVNQVTASGGFYFSAAGNEGHLSTYSSPNSVSGSGTETGAFTSSTWEGDYANGGSVTKIGKTTVSGTVNAFNNGVMNPYSTQSYGQTYNISEYPEYNQDYNSSTEEYTAGTSVFQWADPPTGSSNDYDLYVTNAGGTTTYSSSTSTQNGSATSTPVEIALTKDGYRQYLFKKSPAVGLALHLTNYGEEYVDAPSMQFSTTGTTYGHAATANGFGVAAVPATTNSDYASYDPTQGSAFTTASTSDFFSSDGPRTVFYNVTGGPNLTLAVTPTGYTLPVGTPAYTIIGNGTFAGTGTVRTQPFLSAADGVTAGGLNSTVTASTGEDFTPFFGTSAATPHAASIAALVMSYYSTSAGGVLGLTVNGGLLSLSDMQTVLQNATLDIEAPGYDYTTGYGIVMPTLALQYLTNFLSGAVTAAPADTTATITWPTDLPSTTTVNYGTTTALGSTVSSITATTTHTATLAGLQPNTTYFYEIASATASGAVSYADQSPRSFVTTSTTRPVLGLANVAASNGAGVTSVSVQITDTGGVAANVQITAASLAGEATATTLPVNLGSIPAGSSATTTLTFPLIASGTHTVLNVTASDGTGAVYTLSVRVAIP